MSKPKPLFSEVRSQIPRRDILQTGILGGVAAAIAPALSAGRVFAAEVPKPLPIPAFEFEEATVSDLESRMSAGQISAATLSQAFLERIQDVDKNGPRLNSVIEVNPDALGIRKLARAGPAAAPLQDEVSIPVELLDATVSQVGDEYIAESIDGNAARG